jgi:regulator of sigma D
MGFVKKFLGKFKKDANTAKEIKVDTTYNVKLIENFKHDHQELLKIFSEVKKTFQNDKNAHKKVVNLLNDFKIALEIHLMIEDNKLYSYLIKKYGSDDIHKAFVEDIQAEMTNIAKEVMFFIRKYTNRQSYDNNIDNFLPDLNNIDEVLTRRIKMEEEKLYALYV